MRAAVAGVALALVAGLGACSSEDGTTPGGSRGSSTPATSEVAASEAAGSAEAREPDGSAEPAQARLVAPKQAANAAQLARRLVAAEDLVRDVAASDAARTQAAFETQILYRQLARTPAWRDRVLATVGGYRATVVDHLAGRQNLRSILRTLSSTLPAWRIVQPVPQGKLLRFYRKAEREFGVPWEVLAAVNLVETGFGKIRGFSSAGARGPMQFIPATWAAYGEGDIDDPHDAIMAAARYLAHNGGDTAAGLDGALWAYNHHDGYVRGIRAYARILERDPDALEGLHRWQILYLSTRGDVWLPIGYRSRTSVPVDRYVRRHPDRLLSTSTR